jgi:4-amino-4-deoxy-L-arabinose transferase-like glycosyltransferase
MKPPVSRRALWTSARLQLLLPLFAALIVRLLAWWLLPYRGQISDEAEYLAAATWLANGRGFSFFKAWIWTRPPVYVIFLAAHIKLFGPENVWPIRVSQTIISVVTVALTMVWAARLAPPPYARRVALLTGWAMALSYGLATYAFLLLSETLFLGLLILGLLLLTLWAQLEPSAMGRWRPALLVAGGAVLGLGALTRGMLAGAMPFVAAWVWRQAARAPKAGKAGEARGRASAFWRGVSQAALLTVAVSGVILPWSIWNTRFFGGNGFILIDTTAGYNALLGAQAAHQEIEPAPECAGQVTPRCDKQLYNLLNPIHDQAARQSEAYRLAWEWISQNPAGFARKVGRELIDLLTINYGGAERLVKGYTQGNVPIPHLLGLFVDDALYFLAAPLAVAGFARRQRRPGKGLALVWLLYNLVTGPLFFAINRFRLPLLPVLFIYAACAIAQRREEWAGSGRRAVGFAGATALLLFLLPSFGYWGSLRGGMPAGNGNDSSILRNTFLGIRARVVARDCDHAETALSRADLDAAQRFVDRGSAYHISGDFGLDCFALLQARIDARRGEARKALALLQSMNPKPERFLLEGEIYQRLGQRNRAWEAIFARELEDENPTAWAWKNLQPAPATEIDLGSGFDWGYIDGFYGREGRAEDPGNFRWTSPRARLRFPAAGAGAPQTLQLYVAAGARPPIDPPARVTVSQLSPAIACPTLGHTVEIGRDWQRIDIPLGATDKGGDVVVELRSTTFINPGELPERQQVLSQIRFLGVRVDWAKLVAGAPEPDCSAAALKGTRP